MCDINEISKRSEEIISDANKAIAVSGAIIIESEEGMKNDEITANESMKKLSFLL